MIQHKIIENKELVYHFPWMLKLILISSTTECQSLNLYIHHTMCNTCIYISGYTSS